MGEHWFALSNEPVIRWGREGREATVGRGDSELPRMGRHLGGDLYGHASVGVGGLVRPSVAVGVDD